MIKLSKPLLGSFFLCASSVAFANAPLCTSALEIQSLSQSHPIRCHLGKGDNGVSNLYVGSISLNPGPVTVQNPASFLRHRVSCTFSSAQDKALVVSYFLSQTTPPYATKKVPSQTISANGQYTFDSGEGYMFNPNTGINITEVGANPAEPESFFNVDVDCRLVD